MATDKLAQAPGITTTMQPISNESEAISLPLRPKPVSQDSAAAEAAAAIQPVTDQPVEDPTASSSAKAEVGEDGDGNDDDGLQEVNMEKPKKKKKKSKKGGMKGQNAPSGFEEYYVDAPVTPAEFSQEKELYSTSRPFSDRIQIAIQRYSAKRKFDSMRRHLWVRYLQFGGIRTGQKQFGGGLDVKEIDEDATAADIITLKATEHVPQEIIDDETKAGEDDHDPRFVIDFDGVMRAFLSLYIRSHFDVTTLESVTTYCGMLRNWLNYLLHHNVADDHKDDIVAARKSVDTAEKELLLLIDAPSLLPGTFGSACKALYIDSQIPDDAPWAQWQMSNGLEELDQEQAGRIFLAALASKGTDELCDRYSEQNEENQTRIVTELETGLEITAIVPADKAIKDMYAHPSNHKLTPMGEIHAQTWWCPWAPDEDLTEEEEVALPAKQAAETRNYVLWMDDETLKKLAVGMKMTADLRELSFGLWFVLNVRLIYPSYSLLIPNELMEGWREHEHLPPKKKAGLQLAVAGDDEGDQEQGNGETGADGDGTFGAQDHEKNTIGNTPYQINGSSLTDEIRSFDQDAVQREGADDVADEVLALAEEVPKAEPA